VSRAIRKLPPWGQLAYSLRMNSLHRVVLTVSLLLAGGVGAEVESPLSLEEIGDAFGISARDVAAVRKGKRVGGDLNLVSDNELSMALALRTSATPAEIWQYIAEERTFSVDPTIVQYGVLGEDAAASLAKLELPDAEIERLANAEPGPDVNLSSAEIESLQKIAASKTEPKERREALLEGFRQILVGRFEAYRKGGLGAVVPYDRGDGEVASPAVELGHALGELRATKKLGPDVYDAMARFPNSSSEGVERRFYWIVHGAEDQLLVTLSHRVYGRRDGNIVEFDHRYYVNHTVNSMQVVSVVVTMEGKSVVIYANRTYTDLVAGFMGAVARGIGRTIMRSEIGGTIDAFEEAVDSP
jgi:hypothetical protein